MPKTPEAIGSYQGLLAEKSVDAIYIPLPTGLRKEWVLRAAAAGKHVVCEKPCAANLTDLQQTFPPPDIGSFDDTVEMLPEPA